MNEYIFIFDPAFSEFKYQIPCIKQIYVDDLAKKIEEFEKGGAVIEHIYKPVDEENEYVLIIADENTEREYLTESPIEAIKMYLEDWLEDNYFESCGYGKFEVIKCIKIK